MLNNALEFAALGFGVVTAVVLGNRAQKTIAAQGGSTAEQFAAGAVVGGACAVVLPLAAVGGVVITGCAAYDFVKAGKHKTLVSDTKVKFHELKAQATAKFDKNEPAEEV